jgi:hypothetical protein
MIHYINYWQSYGVKNEYLSQLGLTLSANDDNSGIIDDIVAVDTMKKI